MKRLLIAVIVIISVGLSFSDEEDAGAVDNNALPAAQDGLRIDDDIDIAATKATVSAEERTAVLEEKNAVLEERLWRLERRIMTLENMLEPVLKSLERDKRIDAQRVLARARMNKDLKTYSVEQIRSVERLYQIIERNPSSSEARKCNQELLRKYPKSNRAGCATVDFAFTVEGRKKARLLQKAIEDYSDCYYPNGVQVGAYSRFLLGCYYEARGKPKSAMRLFDEIKSDYADAIDEKGNLITSLIDSIIEPENVEE